MKHKYIDVKFYNVIASIFPAIFLHLGGGSNLGPSECKKRSCALAPSATETFQWKKSYFNTIFKTTRFKVKNILSPLKFFAMFIMGPATVLLLTPTKLVI